MARPGSLLALVVVSSMLAPFILATRDAASVDSLPLSTQLLRMASEQSDR